MCTRAVWLHKGRVVQDGDAVEIARAYRLWAWKMAHGEESVAANLLEEAFRTGHDTHVAITESTSGGAPRHVRS